MSNKRAEEGTEYKYNDNLASVVRPCALKMLDFRATVRSFYLLLLCSFPYINTHLRLV